LLVASASASLGDRGDDLSAIEEALKEVPATISRALVQLIHGQEVVIDSAADFFHLFALAEKAKAAVCQKACQSLVSEGKYSQCPIRIRLSAEQAGAVRKQLWVWQSLTSPLLVDATVAAAEESLDEGPKEHIRAHGVLLAASCEYLRGLWAGHFSETAKTTSEYELCVDDKADLGMAKHLVKVLYGEPIELASMKEVQQLCRLADRWQCEAVRAPALRAMEEHMDMDAFLQAIQEPTPPPEVMLRAAVAVIAKRIGPLGDRGLGLPSLREMSPSAALSLLQAGEGHEPVLLVARVRLLNCLTLPELRQQFLSTVSPQHLGSIISGLNLESGITATVRRCMEKFLPGTPGLVQPISEWLQTNGGADGVSDLQHSLPNAPEALKRLLALQFAVAEAPSSTRVEELFERVFEALFKNESITAAISLLNEWCDCIPQTHEGRAVSYTLAYTVANIETLMTVPEWVEILPEAMARLLIGACKRSTVVTALPEQLARWAQETHSEVNRALGRLGELCRAVAPTEKSPNASVAKGENFASAVRGAILKCFEAGDVAAPTSICEVLNMSFGAPLEAAGAPPEAAGEAEVQVVDQPEAKRRRKSSTSSLDVALLGPEAWLVRKLAGAAALEWVEGQPAKRMESLSACAAWLDLGAEVLVEVCCKMPSQDLVQDLVDEIWGLEPPMYSHIAKWVLHVEAREVFRALRCAVAKPQEVQTLLNRAAEERMLVVEKQNAVLEGKKFKQELDAAVSAVKSEMEAKLQQAAEDEQRRYEKLLRECQERLAAMQKRVLEAVMDEKDLA